MSSAPASLVRYAWISVVAALVTFVFKLLAWQITGSVGMLSDALETLANLVAAFVAVASLTVAARPADDDHAYGHTKVEYFAGGVEGALILLAAGGIGWNAVYRLLNPQELEQAGLGLVFTVIASVINFVVARLLLRVGKQHGSVTLVADAQHLLTDVWTSAAVVLAVVLVAVTDWLWIDPILGLLLAAHIVITGIKLVHQCMLGLMDTGFPPEELEVVRGVLNELDAEGLHYHALRTRQAGARRFMSVHVLFPGDWTVTRAHARAEKLEHALRDAVPRLTVLTHLEPIEDPASWEDQDLDRRSAEPSV